MHDFQISPLADVPQLVDCVVDTSWNLWEATIRYEFKLQSKDDYKCQVLDQLRTFYVAHTNAMDFIGMISLEKNDLPSICPHYTPWTANLFVDPAWRRQGIAAKLLDHIKSQNIGSELYLWCDSKLNDFYKKHGYSVILETEYFGKTISVMHFSEQPNGR